MISIVTIFDGQNGAILHERTADVDDVLRTSTEFGNFVRDLTKTMVRANGVGIAAPQVGRPWRVAILQRSAIPGLRHHLVIINPIITNPSARQIEMEEGCLSIPGVFGFVTRPEDVVLEYTDVDGARQHLRLDGLGARVAQHEVDHLDGILFTDRKPRISAGAHLLL